MRMKRLLTFLTLLTLFIGVCSGSNTFQRITNTRELEAGKHYLLVYETTPAVMGAISNGSSKYGLSVTGTSNFTLNNGVITLTDNTSAEILTLGGAATEWTFKLGDNYLFYNGSSGSSGNMLSTESTVSNKSQWVIQFDNDGNAKISNLYSINNQGTTGGVRYIKYYSSYPRFACFLDGQQAIQLYKEVEETPQPPTFDPDPSEMDEIPLGMPIFIESIYEDGVIHYLIGDATDNPSDEDVLSGTEYDSENGVYFMTPGEHTIFAVVEANGACSAVASATYTAFVYPPAFFNYSGDMIEGEVELMEGEPIWIESFYGEDGVIHYVIDPEEAPNAADLNENGTLYDYYGDGVTFSAGQHTIYAVVEIEGYLSSVASITVNVVGEGDWHLVYDDVHLGVEHYEYIIVNSVDGENTKVAGPYQNGHFTALPCEGNITFGPYNQTATVTGTDVKIFSLEFIEDGFNQSKYCYLKDAVGNYYAPTESGTIEQSQTPIRLLVLVNGNGYVEMYVEDSDNGNSLAYDYENNYFNAYNVWNDGDNRGIIMYLRPKPTTLAEAEAGELWQYYTISDELLAVKFVTDDFNIPYLFCKDEGPSAFATENTNNYEDYMTVHSDFNGNWDQSNWIGIKFYGVSDNDLEKIKSCEGKRLKANTVTVYLSDRNNFIGEMSVSKLETASDQITTYSPNLYCPANFLQSNQNGNATGSGAYADRHYFFMNPKLEEYCEITFAVWDGYNFVLPAPDGTNNLTGISGAFHPEFFFNDMYVEDPETGEIHNLYDDLVVGRAYRFYAIVQGRAPKKAPALKDDDEQETVTPGDYDPDWYYTVYPVGFDPKDPENIITDIDTVNMYNGNGEVKSVKYVNVAGMVSDTPFQGVNIVVTEYTDGTRTTTKMLKK